MKVIAWNIRDLNKGIKQKGVANFPTFTIQEVSTFEHGAEHL